MDTEDRDHFTTIAGARDKLLEGLPSKQGPDNSASGPDQAWYLDRARILFGCYRRDDANDPEIYAAAVGAVLGTYPRHIVELATDPRTGIALKSKFLPTLSEVNEFCEAELVREDRFKRYEGLVPVPTKPVPIKPGQITYDEFLARAKSNGLLARAIGRFEQETIKPTSKGESA